MAQMEALMNLQERWEKNQARKSFFAALAKFQAKVPVIPKTKTAKINSQKGFFTYKFADLGTITKTIKPVLEECGLSFRWEFAELNGKLKATCLISHCDGHTESTSMEAGMDNSGAKNDIQQKGSTQTYLQRYTLIGGLGISTAEEDNDGANHPKTTKPEKQMPTEEEYLDQWQQIVNDAKTQIELTTLYTKNKKTVDKDEKVKAMFKTRQEQIKSGQPKTNGVTLP